ncbi:MAG: TerC family protein [Desulfobacteraceae bacterium]|nr:TerC family protein [Desulfobacteraceae bacterium]
MDFAALGSIDFSLTFLYSLLSIILIDVILAGDNAVIIAMAVRSLPQEKRRKGIIFGAGGAVVLRLALTFFISQLLQIPFVKLVGGLLILWIAVKLFVQGVPGEEEREATSLAQAVKIIMIADISMSLDNMLAVAGASQGNFFLLMFGLSLSIPLIIFTSGLLSMLMDRYPIIIYIGAAVLGRVGGEMVISDPAMQNLLHTTDVERYIFEAVCAIGVIVVGKLLLKRMIKNEQPETFNSESVQPKEE